MSDFAPQYQLMEPAGYAIYLKLIPASKEDACSRKCKLNTIPLY
jgi:hypothetical protein